MVICICAFTSFGKILQKKLETQFNDILWITKKDSEDLKLWISDAFSKRFPVIFIGATGIAVRSIADFVHDKLHDSPVLVMDENCKFIIPLLSGHVGGANEIARIIGERTGAVPVITTATDVQDLFSVDVFAVKNSLKIINRDGIKKFSSKLLTAEKPLTVWINPKIKIKESVIPPELQLLPQNETPEYADLWIESDFCDERLNNCLLFLEPKVYCVGIGCKKGKTFEELKHFLEKTLTNNQLEGLSSISSIVLKENELGLQTLAQYYNIPFNVYTSSELENVLGEFTDSDFVEQTTGVGNVCERSAVLSAGENGKLILKKTAENGITLALAKKTPEIITWWTK